VSISDDRLAELIEQASQGDPIRVGYMEDMETALRELQQLRQRVQPHNFATVNWPCTKCGQQIWLDHECQSAS
jgi:hypothetical protein